jgi:hypothetical protein
MSLPIWIAAEEWRRARLAPAIEALRVCQVAPDRRQARADVLGVWAARPAAWSVLGADKERRRSEWLARELRALLTLPSPSTVRAAVGAATPNPVAVQQLLTYRNLWNDFVLSTARGALFVAAEASKIASGGDSSVINPALWSNAPENKASIAGWIAKEMQSGASALVGDGAGNGGCWNEYAKVPSDYVLTNAGTILASEQDCVLYAGQFRADIVDACPSLSAPAQDPQGNMMMTAPATSSAQASAIAALQTAGLVGEGILQLLGFGVEGGFEMLGQVAAAAKKAVQSLSSALPLLPVAALVLGGAILLGRR